MRHPIYVGSNSYVWNTNLNDWRRIEKLYSKLNSNRIKHVDEHYSFAKKMWNNISKTESGVELFCVRNLKKNNVLMYFDSNGNHYNENVSELKLENYKISLGYFDTPIEVMINKRLSKMITATKRSDFISRVFLMSISKYLTDDLHKDYQTMTKRVYSIVNCERNYGFTGNDARFNNSIGVMMLWSPFNKIVTIT